jgi:hypothetical protein
MVTTKMRFRNDNKSTTKMRFPKPMAILFSAAIVVLVLLSIELWRQQEQVLRRQQEQLLVSPTTTAVTLIAKEQQQLPSPSSKSPSSSSFSYCSQTYFWGGGKAGTTTLFYLLTGGLKGQITTPFVPENHNPKNHVGKEPCFGGAWAKWEAQARDQTICNGDSGKKIQLTHIVNGCPRRIRKNDAQQIMALNTAKANANANADTTETLQNHKTFLMLIRDPVDRLVSHINDNRRRGGKRQSKRTVEELVQNLMLHPVRGKISGFEGSLSYQGENLANLLSVIPDPSDVLIIPMESMSTPQTMQGVADAVSDHVGAERWKVSDNHNSKNTSSNNNSSSSNNVLHLNNGNKKSDGNSSASSSNQYATLSNATTESLRNFFRKDVKLLEELVGKRFSWSSWVYDENETTNMEDWLVTTPHPSTDLEKV